MSGVSPLAPACIKANGFKASRPVSHRSPRIKTNGFKASDPSDAKTINQNVQSGHFLVRQLKNPSVKEPMVDVVFFRLTESHRGIASQNQWF